MIYRCCISDQHKLLIVNSIADIISRKWYLWEGENYTCVCFPSSPWKIWKRFTWAFPQGLGRGAGSTVASVFYRLKEQFRLIRWIVELNSSWQGCRGIGVKGGRVDTWARGGCSDSSSGVIRVGDVPLQRTDPELEPLSPEAEGTPPPQPPTLVEAKGYYDMLSNKSSRISQLIVYIEVS